MRKLLLMHLHVQTNGIMSITIKDHDDFMNGLIMTSFVQ